MRIRWMDRLRYLSQKNNNSNIEILSLETTESATFRINTRTLWICLGVFILKAIKALSLMFTTLDGTQHIFQ